MKKTHILWYSGGANSWASGMLLSKKFGKDNVKLVFADTLIEDEDLYRFLLEGAKIIGSELIWLKEGSHPWEIFREKRFINHRAANCSHEPKFKPCEKWLKTCHPNPDEVCLYVGVDMNEYERMNKIRERWAPYKVEAPLCMGDHWMDRTEIFKLLKDNNLKLPRLYKLGFAHNNCGGFCVRAGKRQFEKLFRNFPEKYEWHIEQEKEFREVIGRDDVGILRQVHQGKTTIISLEEFKKIIIQKQNLEDNSIQLELFDGEGCGCFIS